MVVDVSLILLGAATLLAVILAKKYLLGRKDVPPQYKEFPYIPWLGSLWQFAVNPREFLLRAEKVLGDTFTIKLFGTNMTFLMDSEGHETFFRGKEEIFDIREAYKCTIVTFGKGACYDCPPHIMGQQFGFFKDCLADRNFINYVEVIQEEVNDYFTKTWGDSGEKCLFTALSEVFTLTSARCLLGPEIRSKWTAEFAECYRDLDHSFIPITFFFPNMPNPYRSKCVRARKLFENLFTEVMNKRRANKEHFDDFLQVLMEAKYRNGKALTPQEITSIMIATLLGGQHTSNVTGTWALCHMLLDDDLKAEVMAEQGKLLNGKLGQDLSYDDVKQLDVLDRFLSETLRLHPPFFQLARVVTEDTKYRDYVIPKGNMVAISPGAAMRLESLWEDPNKFDPTRFYPENVKKHKKHAWIPFGGGRHQCSGRKFAVTSLKVGIAWLLRNYKLEIVNKEMPKEDYTTMVVAPTGPVTVRYTRIKHD